MNPILNPFNAFPLIKSVLYDPRRIYKMNPKQLQKYRDKSFRKMIRHAYTVPLYHDKYKKAGVHPNDIKGIDDIIKLPFITKKDLVDNYPDRIMPMGYNKNKSFVICTGGTTGKPVSIYTDIVTMGKAAGITLRELQYFNLHWRKSKFVHIGNFNQYRIDKIAEENFVKHTEKFVSMKNRFNIDVSTPIKEMINMLEEIKPDIIMSYPAIFQHLAYLRRKGYGKNINATIFWTGGAMLDDYTKKYVEDAFGCRLMNVYPSVEAGADIAFECNEGTWHIHPDYFHLEAIDESGKLVAEGERGHLAITKLWGRSTPIIRYIGMDDWVRIEYDSDCVCGYRTPILIKGVEGRKRANIVLPNGKVFPPGAFCFITPVLHKLNTFKVVQYQVIQKKINEVEILLVIDEDLRNEGPSVETIMENIKEIYRSKVGPDVKINVKEVKEIKNKKDASKPPPIVISHVTQEDGYEVLKSKD